VTNLLELLSFNVKVLFLVFTLFIWGFLLFLSLNNWSLIGARSFIGLDNYSRVLGDEIFWIALRNTAVYALLVAVANKFQTILMAPTEVLAQQHWQTIEQYLAKSRVMGRLKQAIRQLQAEILGDSS